MTDSKLVSVGQIPLLKEMTREVAAMAPTKERFLDAAVDIRQEPDDYELAYMARELVQCTLPHSNPGDIPVWTRTNGNIRLVIVRTTYDSKKQKLVGFPYGSTPRLLLFWMTTEAVQTGKRRLELGDSYAGFLRDIGLDPSTGGGKRSDAARVKEQTRRLFGAAIGIQKSESVNGLEHEQVGKMLVSSKSELWWDPKSPEQLAMWGSWVELGEDFYKTITTAPVPADMRALRVLKRSPLALDLYVWATYKALTARRKGKPLYVPWQGLMKQFGADYGDPKDFRKKAIAKLKMIQAVYPGLKLADASGGLQILPTSTPAIPTKSPS